MPHANPNMSQVVSLTRAPRLLCLLSRRLITIVFATGMLAARAATPDPSLVLALEGIWQGEHPAVSLLGSTFAKTQTADLPRYATSVKNAPAYVILDGANTFIEYARKQYPADTSPWGPLPQLDIANARLLELSVASKRYLVIAASGSGLYSVGDWQRFGFLHVLDVTNHANVVEYPLVAEAGLGDKVLGRLPDSGVLNYARLVPARWANNISANAYEVLLYALKPKGAERVTGTDGHYLSYLVSRASEQAPWTLQRVDATPVALARDAARRSFSAPPLKQAGVLPPPAGKASAPPIEPATLATPAVIAPPATPTPAPANTKGKQGGRLDDAKSAAGGVAKDAVKDAADNATRDAINKHLPGSPVPGSIR